MPKYIVIAEIRASVDVEVEADSLESAINKVKNERKIHEFMKDDMIIIDGRLDVSGVLNQEVNYEPMK